jgi:hypothetical protein
MILRRTSSSLEYPDPNASSGARHLSHARAEDRKLKKDRLEVLALKVPFRTALSAAEFDRDEDAAFPNQAPWPGRLRDSIPAKTLDAGRARELQKSAQPATQMLSIDCLYQTTFQTRKQEMIEKHKSL